MTTMHNRLITIIVMILALTPSSATVLALTEQSNPGIAAASFLALQPIPYSSKMAIHHGPVDKPLKVALTFDDGPDRKFTPQILDILKELKIKATFFVIGKNAAKNPTLIERIEREGHILANHSWDHANFAKLNREQIQQEIMKTDKLLTELTGHRPILFRAPYGNVTPILEKELRSTQHLLIGWSVDTRDWAGPDVDTIMATVTRQIRPGGIILQHAANGPKVDLSNTVQALPKIVKMLKDEGYEFVTVPELLSTEAYKTE